MYHVVGCDTEKLIYIYIYIICLRVPHAYVGGYRSHNANTMPTHCPHNARHNAHFGNRLVFGVLTKRNNIECEGSVSSFMLELQMLDDSHVGTVTGTVWALCGHCVGTVQTVPANIIMC